VGVLVIRLGQVLVLGLVLPVDVVSSRDTAVNCGVSVRGQPPT